MESGVLFVAPVQQSRKHYEFEYCVDPGASHLTYSFS